MQPQPLKPAFALSVNCTNFHIAETVSHITAAEDHPSNEAELGPAGVAGVWCASWLAGSAIIAGGVYAINAVISYLVGGA